MHFTPSALRVEKNVALNLTNGWLAARRRRACLVVAWWALRHAIGGSP